MFYKIIQNENFIGIVTEQDFKSYYKIAKFFGPATENNAEGVYCNEKFYHDSWMKPIGDPTYPREQASIFKISEEEYNALYEAIEKEKPSNQEELNEIFLEANPPEEPVIDDYKESIPLSEEVTIEFMRNLKINEMSKECHKVIENGIDIEIRGEQKHFSLNTEDQINLINLGILAQTESYIPYHADGEECIFYSPTEINQIITAANKLKIYHTTYYNALKSYINSLESINEIKEITYGIQIPEEFQTDVLKSIINNA